MSLNHPILAPRVLGLERDLLEARTSRPHQACRSASLPGRFCPPADGWSAGAVLALLAARLRAAGFPTAPVAAGRG